MWQLADAGEWGAAGGAGPERRRHGVAQRGERPEDAHGFALARVHRALRVENRLEPRRLNKNPIAYRELAEAETLIFTRALCGIRRRIHHRNYFKQCFSKIGNLYGSGDRENF